MNGRKIHYHGRRWTVIAGLIDTKHEVGIYFHHDDNWAEIFTGLYFFLISFYVERRH